MPAYYTTTPSPHTPGRWLVVHAVPGTSLHSVDEDCPSLASAEKQAAWLESERAAATHGQRQEPQPTPAHAGTRP